MTQSQIIKKYLESQNGFWVIGNSLDNLVTSYGFLSARASRTARQMAQNGEIEVKYDFKNGKRLVWYRSKQPKDFLIYKVGGEEVARVPRF